ncbi:MAG TPA: hypothetical protein VNO30_06555 [Kofleriaceae bacterium]|nr:hypothetical protein [Kofleriaceae bacterium]
MRTSASEPGKQTLPGPASRMDVVKARLAIGNGEDGHHRAGGSHAQAANVALISADAQQRAEQLHRVLRTGVGNHHNFELIAPWLMGEQSAQLAAAYQELAGMSLGDTITSVFGGQVFMRRYLLDVLERGEPGLGSRLAMASGLVTHTKSDWAEVLRLLRAAEPAEVSTALGDAMLRRHLETSSRVKAVIEVAGKQEAHDQATEAVTTAREAGDPEALATAEAAEQGSKQALNEAKNAELVAIVRHRQQPGRGLERGKLIADLATWAKRNEPEVREQAVAPGSPFELALASQAAATNPLARLSQPDRTYLLAVARGAAPVSDDLLGPEAPSSPDADAEPQTAEEQESEATKRREKRDETAKDAGLKTAELDAYITRKTDSNHTLKPQRWSTLKGKIEDLDDEQRAVYLRQQMTPEDREIFDAEDSTAEQREAVRRAAMSSIRARLIGAGMDEKVADRVMASFQAAAAPNSSRYHSTYQKLRRLAFGGPALQFSKQAFRLVGQLANQEYLQVRDDTTLMAALQARCDAPVWEQITAVLGHAPASETANPDGLSGKEARERGSNEAELAPAHWTALLQRELAKHGLAKHEDKVLSVATRAYYAAQRRAALPPGDEGRKPELPRGLAPMAVVEFTGAVLAGLSADQRTQLEREDPAGYEALRSGRAVTATERITAATFGVMSLKRLKGTNARPSDIVRAVEDARGNELLEEWSNVASWRALQAERTQRAAEPPGDERDQALAHLDAQLRAFVVDIDPEVHAQLRSLLPRDKVVEVLTKLREKLGKAMSDDPAFRAAMLVSGMHADGHAAERTRGIAALDQQRMEDTGAQWNQFMGIGISAKSAESKESRNLLAGRLRSAHGAIEAADDQEAARAEVNDNQVSKIEKTREEHADRMKAAQAVKKRANEIATTVVTILSAITITGATFGTGGLAFAPQIGIALAKALAAGTLRAGLKRALEGDKFNAVETISSITMDLMVTSLMTAGLGGPTGLNAHAEAAAGLKGKKDASSLFASAGMKWAINTAVREAITTASAAAMDADPKKLQLDQEAMIRLRAWVEDFALTMAVTDANRQATGQSQVEKDTIKLIPGVVKPVTAELSRPYDDKLKAERRVLGKSTVADGNAAASGITAQQLVHGRNQLRQTDGPQPAAPATTAHGVTRAELVDGSDQLRQTDGPRPAAPATTAHGVTQAELSHGHEQLQPAPTTLPPADHALAEVTDARQLAAQLANNLATYGDRIPAALRARSQSVLEAYRARIEQAQATLADDQATREQREQATAQLRVMHDRADDANADVVVAVLSSLEVPTHTPELAASSAEPAAGGGEDRERRAEPMMS